MGTGAPRVALAQRPHRQPDSGAHSSPQLPVESIGPLGSEARDGEPKRWLADPGALQLS